MTIFNRFIPFFEHLIIGFLFLWLGMLITEKYDERIWGILGIIASLWGAFKVLIGTLIYGIGLYQYIYNPETFEFIKKRNILRRVEKRITRDLAEGATSKAIDRYHGLIFLYPNDLKLKFKIGKLYLQEGKYTKAGAYLFFKKKNLSKEEQKAIRAFKDSVGNNAFQILRKLVKRTNFKEEMLIDKKGSVIARSYDGINYIGEVKNDILELLEAIEHPNELNSSLVKEISLIYNQSNRPIYIKIFTRERDLIYHLIALFIGFLWIYLA